MHQKITGKAISFPGYSFKRNVFPLVEYPKRVAVFILLQ